METKYIYIERGNTNEEMNLFSDFEKLDNVKCIKTKKKNLKNVLLKIIRKVHLSKKLGKIVHLPLKRIWYDLSELQIEKNNNYVIMMLPNVFFDYDISIIKRYKKYKNVKLVLILLDTVGVNTPAGRLIDTLYKDKMWDYILSYDYNDVQKYGFYYLDESYYSKPEIEEQEIKSDAYFIGAVKPGRTEEIVELFKVLKENNVNVEFDIFNKHDGRYIEYEDKNFHMLKQRKSYMEVLKETKQTNCIIELMQEGQQAQSARYFEAVCFNKKLLTNNKNLKRLSFYNEKYMKYFDKFEDIDFEWVKKKEKIDYGYKGEFSPIHIIEKIEELEKE